MRLSSRPFVVSVARGMSARASRRLADRFGFRRLRMASVRGAVAFALFRAVMLTVMAVRLAMLASILVLGGGGTVRWGRWL